MARSKIFHSRDRRAEVHWRFGYIRDQLTLVVDGRVIEEVEVYGTEGSSKGQSIWKTGVEYRLSGLGYYAIVVMKSRSLFSAPEVVHCEINAGPQEEQDEAEDDSDEAGGSPDAGWTTALALKELGLSPGEHAWRQIREAHAGLVRRYHPDVYASSDLPEDLLRAAALRLQRINEAYSFLRTTANASSRKGGKPERSWAPPDDEVGTPKQRIHWDGQQWIIWDAQLRKWVPQVDHGAEPKQRIRWDGIQWMIWDQRLRCWVPQVDR